MEKAKQRSDAVQLKLHNEVLPVVKLRESYKHEGLKDVLELAVHQGQILRVIPRGSRTSLTFFSSEVLRWQKLAVMRNFMTARLGYHLRHCYPYKQHSIVIDVPF